MLLDCCSYYICTISFLILFLLTHSFFEVIDYKREIFLYIFFSYISQGRPITPVYAMAHNVQRIPAAGGLYGAGYVPITNYAASTATLAAIQKNAAAVYGGYAGYAVPQAFPATAFQLPIHDVYQTY